MSDEFQTMYRPGLPERLPAGERLVWQGRPSFRSMARHSYHAGKAAGYFAALAGLRISWLAADGATARECLSGAVPIVLSGAVSVAFLFLLAWLSTRTTIYSLTTRRAVLHYGIALPMTVNIPFSQVVSADIKSYRDGSGDIALKIDAPLKMAYLNLWPNVRPWHVGQAQPAFRSLANAAEVGVLLAEHCRSERTFSPAAAPAASLSPVAISAGLTLATAAA